QSVGARVDPDGMLHPEVGGGLVLERRDLRAVDELAASHHAPEGGFELVPQRFDLGGQVQYGDVLSKRVAHPSLRDPVSLTSWRVRPRLVVTAQPAAKPKVVSGVRPGAALPSRRGRTGSRRGYPSRRPEAFRLTARPRLPRSLDAGARRSNDAVALPAGGSDSNTRGMKRFRAAAAPA